MVSSHVPLGHAGIWWGGCLDPSRSLLQVNWLSLKQVIYSGPEQHRASTSSPAIRGSLGTLEAAVSHLCSYSTDKVLRPGRGTGLPDQLHALNSGISLHSCRALPRGINSDWASVSPVTPTFQAT